MKTTYVIVDDEVNNIDILYHFINKFSPTLQFLGSSETKEEAIKLIRKSDPQIIFLDIDLTYATGFEVLEELEQVTAQIIFVSAYSNHAIKAFKYNAVDFITKPIDIEKLIFAIESAKERISNKFLYEKEMLMTLMKTIKSDDLSQDFIAIPSIKKVDFIKFKNILYCKSEGRYTEFYLVGNKKIVSSKNIGEYEQLLYAKMFFRIHNSYMVNITHIKYIDKETGDFVVLNNNFSIPISKRKKESFNKFLKLK